MFFLFVVHKILIYEKRFSVKILIKFQIELKMDSHDDSDNDNDNNNDNDNDSCCICMERLTNTKISPCKHILCLECFIKLFQTTKICPICRGQIRYVLTNEKCKYPATVENVIQKMTFHNKNLTKAIRQIIKSNNDGQKIANLIISIARIIPGHITLDESEQFLQELINSGKIFYRHRNILVRLCSEPWNVDLNLGTYGLCYFGNGGKKPTLDYAIKILDHNHCSNITKFTGY